MWFKGFKGGGILMKLIKCYISAFGKFRDYAIDFSNGLNTFVHENGWGKTTLASFLKCMFYGINSKKRNIEENDRIKFAPWNYNEKFGGYVVFEKDGYQIKVERYFGKKESDDTLTLTDVKTGKLFTCPENLGEHIFKIDEDGFTSTVFFTQNDLEVKDSTSLSSKFNFADPTDTKAFDTAVEKIEKKIKEYLNSANRGIIPDLKNKQYSITEKIEQAKLADSTLDNVKKQADVIKEQIKSINEKINKVNNDLKVASSNAVNKEKAETLSLLQQRHEKISKEMLPHKQLLNNVDVDKQELDKYYNCVKDLSIAKERQSLLKEDLNSFESVKNNSQQKPISISLLLIILSVIGFSLGTIFTFINLTIALVVYAISLVGLVVGIYKTFNDKNKKQTVNTLIFDKKKKEFQEFSFIVEKQTEVLETFFNRFNLVDTLDYYQKIEKIKESFNFVEVNQKTLDELLGQIDAYKNLDLTVNTMVLPISELERELDYLQSEYTRLNTELSRVNMSVLRYEELSYSLTDLVNEKMQIQDQIEQATKRNDLLKTTLKFLNQADENIKTLYREPLSNALNEYASAFLEQAKSLNIDIDLNVTINEKAGAKNPKYYSLGFQNLFEICKRFALIDVLYKDNLPFVILDDPFTNLDEEKIESSLALVKKLSNNRQIIYLTCHKSRAI